MPDNVQAQVRPYHCRQWKSRSAIVEHVLWTVVGLGVAYGFFASLAGHSGHASESANREELQPARPLRVASTVDALQRLSASMRSSLQAMRTLPAKEVCRIGEKLTEGPVVESLDTIARYLSKDVRRWSDRMISLYLSTDPRLAKAADPVDMERQLLRKWESERGYARRWLQSCGIAVRATIVRGRPVIEREAPEILADVVAAIATGVQRNEPDAVAAAAELAQAEENLRVSLKSGIVR